MKLLLEDDRRLEAYRELWRRTRDEEEKELSFPVSAEVVVCPQGEGQDPIYLVLSRHSLFIRHTPYELPVEDPEELFGEALREVEPSPDDLSREIDAFTPAGERIRPFGGYNVLGEQGIIADINGDGFVERADHVNHWIGQPGIRELLEERREDPEQLAGLLEAADTAQVFRASVVRREAKGLLAVVYNWGTADEWSYAFSDRNKDGVIEIDFGPKLAKGIKPKVTYRWDKAKKTYVGPSGGVGDHFRVIDPDERRIWDELKRLKREGVLFPGDPEAVKRAPLHEQARREISDEPDAAFGELPKAKSKPYQYRSLRSLSNEEIVRYMAEGRSVFLDLREAEKVPTKTPDSFSSVSPREAALALAQENRKPEHRRQYRLAVDDRDGRQPPDVGSVIFSWRASRCPFAGGRGLSCYYHIRFDPEHSHLAYASRFWEDGFFRDPYRWDDAHDIRLCSLDYERAKHIAQTIWWLNRLRTLHLKWNGSGFTSSTADGEAALRLLEDDGSMALQVQGTSWTSAAANARGRTDRFEEVPGRWVGHYGKDTFLNFAQHLIAKALPEYLGEDWSKFALTHPGRSISPANKATDKLRYEPDEAQLFLATSERILSLFSLDERLISFPIVREAIEVTGDLAFHELSPLLKKIQTQLPTPAQPVRTREVVERELDELRKESEWNSDVASFDFDSEEGRKWSKLHDELEALEHGLKANGALDEIRSSTQLALRKIAAADDPQRLQEWAQSEREGCLWAVRRLLTLDRERYVAALHRQLEHAERIDRSHILSAIAETDPERSAELKKQALEESLRYSAALMHPLTKEARSIPDEEERIERLIQIALDPKSGWLDRWEALNCLVPPDDPLKYRARTIDDALLKLLDPKLADDTVNFTLTKGCMALALRGRTEHFDEVAVALKAADYSEFDEILGSLALMTLDGGLEEREKLLAIVRPHLKKTSMRLDPIFQAIWIADLRPLKADVERTATSGPEDYEGTKAFGASSVASSVKGRYHLARKITALWNEEDPVTKGKLLVAFGFHEGSLHAGYSGGDALERRMKAELESLAGSMSASETDEVLAFLRWYEREYHGKGDRSDAGEAKTAFGQIVVDILKTPSFP